MSDEAKPTVAKARLELEEARERAKFEKYRPRTLEQKLGYLIEECGEVLAAVGKSLRWGLGGFNPELPYGQRELNGDWIQRELADLERALSLVKDALNVQGYPARKAKP